MVARSRHGANKAALQLRISLMDVTPTIWRRLLVPGEIKLSKLHTIFQTAMGWEDYHLHSFEIDGERFSTPISEQDDDIDEVNEETVVFSEVVSDRTRFFYEYDFGDSWRHEVVVESIDPIPTILKFAVCIDGQRACPPKTAVASPAVATYSRPFANPATKRLPKRSVGLVALTLSSSTWPLSTPPCSGCAESRLSPFRLFRYGYLLEAVVGSDKRRSRVSAMRSPNARPICPLDPARFPMLRRTKAFSPGPGIERDAELPMTPRPTETSCRRRGPCPMTRRRTGQRRGASRSPYRASTRPWCAVTNGIATTRRSRRRLRKSPARSILSRFENSEWWLIQMIPMTKKLTTYEANDGRRWAS